MPGLNDTAKNSALDHVGTLITHLSIHDVDPGAEGTNGEIGTRQAVSWNSASSGNLDSVGTQEFAITSGQTVHSVGFWSAESGGTYYGAKALPEPESFSNDGTFTVNDLDINLT